MKKYISPKLISLVFGILVICFAIGFYVFSWVEPLGDAPFGNVPAPLNTSSNPQVKVGGLILNTGEAEVGLAVAEGKVGIGTLSPATKLDIFTNPASTNTVEEMIRLTRASQGVVQAGMGSSINFWLEIAGASEVPKLTGKIENVLTGTANLDADLVFSSWSGATLKEGLRLHQGVIYGGDLFINGLVVDGADETLYVDKNTNSVGIGTDYPQSRLQVDNGYLQIDTVAGSPPAGDCNINVRGRMVLGRSPEGPDSLYICGDSGWGYVELTPL